MQNKEPLSPEISDAPCSLRHPPCSTLSARATPVIFFLERWHTQGVTPCMKSRSSEGILHVTTLQSACVAQQHWGCEAFILPECCCALVLALHCCMKSRSSEGFLQHTSLQSACAAHKNWAVRQAFCQKRCYCALVLDPCTAV